MNDQFCFVPTGELRRPFEGEYYRNLPFDEIYLAKSDVMAERPIYRRIDFSVVLGLVEACEVASATCSPYGVCKIDKALAAAREAGIGGERG